MSKKTLKGILDDQSLIRDIKSIITLILAFAVAIISNGLIQGFDPQILFSGTSLIAGFGLWAGIELVTNDATERSQTEHSEKGEVAKEIEQINKYSDELDHEKGRKWVSQWNKKELSKEIEKKRDRIIIKKERKKEKKELKLAILTSVHISWWRLIKKYRRMRLRQKVRKLNAKIDQATNKGVYVKYEPISLEDLLMAYANSQTSNMSEKEQMIDNPARNVRRRMRGPNLIKALFFFAFQGAALSAAGSWWELLGYIFVVATTLTTTALVAYFLTRNYTLNIHLGFLKKKRKRIEQMMNDIGKAEDNARTEIQQQDTDLRADETDTRRDKENGSENYEEDRGGEELEKYEVE